MLIVLNTLVLATDHHPMDQEFATYLEGFNFAFSLCFMLEMVLKVSGEALEFCGSDSLTLPSCRRTRTRRITDDSTSCLDPLRSALRRPERGVGCEWCGWMETFGPFPSKRRRRSTATVSPD